MDLPQKSAYIFFNCTVSKSHWPEKSGKGALEAIVRRENSGKKRAKKRIP